MKIIQVFLMSILILGFPFSSYANENIKTTFLDWNEGEGTNWLGWTWSDDVAFGNPGWILDVDPSGPLGGGQVFSNGQTRSINKGDYGKNNLAEIEINDRAPSTTSGGSLKVYEPEGSADNQTTWWVWYDGKPLSERGVTDSNTDRMSFYLKTEGMDPLDPANLLESNFHIGTYLCWYGNTSAFGSGDGCPYEGVGNQHYYHWLSINSGGWIHVLLDQMPQHRRGRKNGDPIVLNNPVKLSDDKNYFEQLAQFYMETTRVNNQNTTMYIDEIEFYNSGSLGEPLQNDESISSIWVGYFPNTAHWEIGFMDNSFQTYGNETYSTFEVRWSLQPITNANWKDASLVELQYYSGLEYTSKEQPNVFRRANAWKRSAWNKFTLNPDVLSSANVIYIAVKDVSVKGQGAGKKWPYNFNDGHDAPSNYIKTIDYSLIGIHGNAVKAPAKPPETFNTRIISN